MTREQREDDEFVEAAARFEVERRQLLHLAYRLLGSVADAEDAVQTAGARWCALGESEQSAIRSPAAWLTTVTSRVCLDVLDSARVRRERYIGEWLPEPVPDDLDWPSGARSDWMDPADRITLDESLTMAFLVVLEAMTPAERVVFVLHDVFRFPFGDVGRIVGRSPEACRQLASSGRRRVRTAAVPTARPGDAAVVRRFKEAWAAHDLVALVELLDPDAVAVADGGGLATADPLPMRGGARIAEACVAYADRMAGVLLEEVVVNGRPGLVARSGGATVTVYSFGIADGRITGIWAMRNPEKLRLWPRLGS